MLHSKNEDGSIKKVKDMDESKFKEIIKNLIEMQNDLKKNDELAGNYNVNLPDYPYVSNGVLSEKRLAEFEKIYFPRVGCIDEKDFIEKNGMDTFNEKFSPIRDELVSLARSCGDNTEYSVSFSLHNLLRKWSDYIETVSILTNGKVDIKDIWGLAIYVEDVMEQLPLTREFVYGSDDFLKGRTILSIVANTLPELVKNLSVKEMRYFIFCMVIRDFLTFSTPKAKEVPGKFIFFTVDFVKSLYEELGTKYLGKEDILPLYDELKPFGFSKENPILAVNVSTSTYLMNSLCSIDGKVSVHRNGSGRGVFGEIIDIYKVTVAKENNGSTVKKNYTMYVNPYSIKNSKDAPEGFMFI